MKDGCQTLQWNNDDRKEQRERGEVGDELHFCMVNTSGVHLLLPLFLFLFFPVGVPFKTFSIPLLEASA